MRNCNGTGSLGCDRAESHAALMALEALAQFGAGAEQTRLGGGDADAEPCGDFFHGEFLEVAEDDNFAHERRDAADFAAEDLRGFALGERLFGVELAVGEFEGDAFFLDGCIDVEKARAAELAQAHEALIGDDAIEPGGEFRFLLKGADVLEGFGEGGLHFVFGGVGIAEDRKRKFAGGGLVLANEFSECGGISLPGAAHEVLFAGSCKLRLDFLHR